MDGQKPAKELWLSKVRNIIFDWTDRSMHKITITPSGASYLQQHFSNTHLPTLRRPSSDPQLENKTFTKQSSRGKLDVAALRNILKDDTIAQINKLKEHTNNRAYLHVKQQLMKGILSNKDFLNCKAQNMAKKMLAEPSDPQNLQTEVSKGRNYLSKLVGEYEVQREEDQKLRARLREKARGGQ